MVRGDNMEDWANLLQERFRGGSRACNNLCIDIFETQ